MRRICFYHAGCPDGFGAALAVWRAWGDDAEYLPRGHDDGLVASRFANAIVAFVDVSLPNRLLRPLFDSARHVILLDHHITAQQRFATDPELRRAAGLGGHTVVFDVEHSGATLAWRHFHPGEPTPRLLEYIEDMDLWRFELPLSEEVNAAVASYPRRFADWEKLGARPISELASEGTPIVRANRMEVERLLPTAHPVQVGDLRIEAVNAARLRSQIGHALASRAAYGTPCGLLYRLFGGRVDISVYSVSDFDVSQIASRYGGGGHKSAAGFSVPLRDWLEKFVGG